MMELADSGILADIQEIPHAIYVRTKRFTRSLVFAKCHARAVVNNAVAMISDPASTVPIESQKRFAEISLQNNRASQ
jgi:hypothetical protein